MANIPLKTIKFPGLDDTYTVPQIDSSFTGVAGEAPDSKKVHDEIDSLKEDLNTFAKADDIGFLAPLNHDGFFWSNNVLTSNALMSCTDLINIPYGATSVLCGNKTVNAGGTVYRMSPNILFFDASENRISTKNNTTDDLAEYAIPADAVYIKVNQPSKAGVSNGGVCSIVFKFNFLGKFSDDLDSVNGNLFNLNGPDIGFIDLSAIEMVDGSYINANGEIDQNTAFRLSDYIEIPWGTKNVVLNRLIWVDDTSYPQTHVVWFYDAEKTMLGTGYGEIRTDTTLIATPYPSAKYMRANFSKAHAVPFILRNATDALRCSRFTFNEIGVTDLDDLERNYIYLRASTSGPAVVHLPYNNWIGTVMTINAPNQLSGSIQLAYSSTGRFHYRVCWGVDNTWTDWVEFLQKSNLNYAIGELGRYTGAFTQQEQLTAPIYLQPNHKYLVKFFNNDRTGSINVFPTLNTSNYKRVMPWMDEAVITTADDDTVRYLNFYNPNSQLDRVDIAVYELDSPLVCVEDKPRLYRVNKDEREGDFTSITECFLALKDDDSPKIIEIWEGDYDIYQEYVDADVPVYTGDNPSMDYFDYCVWVPKNTHVIGKGIVRLKWMPDPSEVSITAMQTRCVSPLNVAGSATIENLEVYCQNGRYVLHNDALGKPEYTGAKQHYINCRFYKYEDAIDSVSGYRYGFGHTTGFGIDRSMSHIYENCLFKNFYTGRAFYGHSRGSVITDENCNSDITLRDCVIETEGTTCIKFGNGSNNLTHIRTTFSGCYISGLIDCVNESGTPTYPNAYDIRFLNCGNVHLHIADEDNRYAPSAYNTVLSME